MQVCTDSTEAGGTAAESRQITTTKLRFEMRCKKAREARHIVREGEKFHRLFFLLSRQEVETRAIDTIFRFNDFVSGPP